MAANGRDDGRGAGSGEKPRAGALGANLPAGADVPPAGDKTVAAVIGEIVWLMSRPTEFKQT